MRRRAVLAVAGVLVLVPVLAVGIAVLVFDGDALRARVVAAVGQATGRVLTVAGPVRLVWSLAPTVSMAGVSLANPPGFSRPAMVTVDRLEVQLALWPLLHRRVEVRSLTLAGPDVLLERDAAGQPNWVFSRVEAPTPAVTPSGPGAPAPRPQVSLDMIRLRDGRLSWPSGGTLHRLDVPFIGADTSASSVVTMGGTLVADGMPLSVGGTTGPLSTAGGAWPVDLVLSGAGGLSVHMAGTLGVNVALTAELDDLSSLSGVAGRPLPALRGVRALAQLGTSGASALTAQAAFDMGPLHLTRLSLASAALDQPMTVAAEGLLAAEGATGLPVTLSGSTGSMLSLLQPGPVPVHAKLQAGAASLAMEGTADPRAGALEAQVSVRVPDMQALGAAAGLRLPALRDAALDARAATAGPGRMSLRGLRLTVPGADVAGDLALAFAPRPSVKGSLVSERLVLDGLAAASAPPLVPTPGPPSAPPVQPAPARLLSDAPLPFDMLRRADVDVQLAINEASWRGASAHAVVTRVLLQDGRLQLGPATAQVPGGAASAQVSADAAAQTLGVVVQAQDLGAGPILALLGTPQGGTGLVDLDIDLHSQGASPRAMGAALSGHAGLTVVDGEFDLGGLLAAAGDVLRRANLPLEAGGRSRVRCLALRLDAAAGQVGLGTLLLDSARLHLDGEGGLNLGDETLDLHLRPQVRLGLGGVSLPLHVSGPLRTPKVEAEIKGGAGRQGLMIGAPAPADDCGPRLTAARGGRAGTMPAAPADAPRTKPADFLRSLLR